MAQEHLNDKVSLTTADLTAMIAAAVQAAVKESRKPDPPTEQELAQLQMKQDSRARSAESVIRDTENKRANQLICSHEHNNGDTHCVWVREEDPASAGFILCQYKQCRIRPGVFDKKGPAYLRDRGAIYDTATYNKLFQKCAMHADMN